MEVGPLMSEKKAIFLTFKIPLTLHCGPSGVGATIFLLQKEEEEEEEEKEEEEEEDGIYMCNLYFSE